MFWAPKNTSPIAASKMMLTRMFEELNEVLDEGDEYNLADVCCADSCFLGY